MRARWGWFQVALGLAAAAPSLAGAALGSPLALDDWGFAAAARYATFANGFGAQTRQRPLSGISDWALFRFFGTHPVPHLVVLAVLNATTAVLLWRLLVRGIPRRVAVLVARVWVALPNRGSTRLCRRSSRSVRPTQLFTFLGCRLQGRSTTSSNHLP